MELKLLLLPHISHNPSQVLHALNEQERRYRVPLSQPSFLIKETSGEPIKHQCKSRTSYTCHNPCRELLRKTKTLKHIANEIPVNSIVGLLYINLHQTTFSFLTFPVHPHKVLA